MKTDYLTGAQSRGSLRRRAAFGVFVLAALGTTVGVTGASGAPSAHASKSVVVSTLKTAKFGTVLVSGKTLYSLRPSSTACNASCLKIWPELLLPKGVTKATAGAGVIASKLGTVKRSGGLQVTYAGKPLYWFSKDTAPGQVKGNVSDTWGKWSDVVTVKPATSGPTTTTTAGAGGGGVGF
jgi:predicted lipoprotein with Yx(FWY)xxD motif